MQVTGTPAAEAVVERARRDRRGSLVFTIGTGCCESTAPFLYEDFWPGPDQEVVGEVGGVPVYAPGYLRRLYTGSDGVVVDAEEVLAESMSIETEYGYRFFLRNQEGGVIPGQEETAAGAAAPGPVSAGPARDVPADVSALRSRGPQELPESLRRARVR